MKKTLLFSVLAFICLNAFAQQSIPELQKFTDRSLFNPNDNSCFKVSGEWVGEEIQYDATQSFIKVKFKVVFKLEQEGNRVYGTSYIQDKYRGSYGDMKIRGMVIGNKLHFEEYEIVNEKFFEKGVVWCLRSGEMTIDVKGNKATLTGLTYNGYASNDYSECTDYAKMSVSKDIIPSENSEKSLAPKTPVEKMDVLIYPNPIIDQANISYELKENSNVRIDIFSLSGKHIETISDGQQTAGKQNAKFNPSGYAAGVYVVRLQAGNLSSTKQIVKTN